MQLLEVFAGSVLAGLVLGGIVYLLRWWMEYKRPPQQPSNTSRPPLGR